ncbi:MAG: KpsF/GutQ family sugar-phosphate isomerase [Alphaproteobacteria bacterium]|nr:KpsF/GutQ family sugar-phosphate isomerase [Alphaproteobacteria bacterium]
MVDQCDGLPSAGAARDIAAGQRVLNLEAEALKALSAALDARFAAAVDLLSRVAGRIVVSGMGKSGHIAKKIAATLASTGAPATFVHPGEASHGDLGMIVAGDAVLCLSNSGETPELADLIAHAKRFAIPLIGITSRPGSTLDQAADIGLILPPAPEACPLGLAPTTSTTLMLGLGDALAVALLERRGFTAEDFQVLHPGGKLGSRLKRVAELMHDGDALPLIGEGATMQDAILVMSAKGYGTVGVVTDDGRLAGVITDGDLRRHMNPGLLAEPVARVMTRGPRTIRPRALASEALGLMNAKSITALFVLDDSGRPVGLIHIHDCLRAGVA